MKNSLLLQLLLHKIAVARTQHHTDGYLPLLTIGKWFPELNICSDRRRFALHKLLGKDNT
jgi:hypothetical protein